MKVIFNITENKNKATFQQEVVKINTLFNQTENVVKPKFQIGYYPLPYALENYYTKNETYSKIEIDDLLDVIEVTKTELDVLVSENKLEPNRLYKITGIESWCFSQHLIKAIYLKAITNNTLESEGVGEFYTPKYNELDDNSGIWKGELFANGMINSLSYNIGDKVIWGNLFWENISGEIGNNNYVFEGDDYQLNNYLSETDWQLITPNDDESLYNIQFCLIKYDLENDYINYREDELNNKYELPYNVLLEIFPTYWIIDFFPEFIYNVNSISLFQWGKSNVNNNFINNSIVFNCNYNTLYFKDNVILEKSIIERNSLLGVNFIGNKLIHSLVRSNYIKTFGGIINNILNNSEISSNRYYFEISNNRLSNNSQINSNNDNDIIVNNKYTIIKDNILDNNCKISLNTFVEEGKEVDNTIKSIYGNELINNCSINNNTIKNGSTIYGHKLEYYSTINGNTLDTESNIYNNQVVQNGKIDNNILTGHGRIYGNQLDRLSEITLCKLRISPVTSYATTIKSNRLFTGKIQNVDFGDIVNPEGTNPNDSAFGGNALSECIIENNSIIKDLTFSDIRNKFLQFIKLTGYSEFKNITINDSIRNVDFINTIFNETSDYSKLIEGNGFQTSGFTKTYIDGVLLQDKFNAETLDVITDRGNITENEITVGGLTTNYVQLDTTSANTYNIGKVYWNETKGTYNFGLKNNVELQLGQEQHVYGKAYSAISNGQLVMYRTSQGGHILFEPANFTQLSANPDLIIGVATQDIALNEFGYITTFGEVNTLNTSSFADGNTLYFGSGNVLQNTVPSGSYFIVGRVNRSHATQGIIFVKPYFVDSNLESKLNKSDSYTASSSTTYASTKALVDGLATKQNSLTNPITGTVTANYIPKSTGSGTITNSIIYENVNGIGIGTTTIPAGYKLVVQGNTLLYGGIYLNGTMARVSANATTGAFDFNYNSGGTGSLNFFGGTTTAVFSVTNAGATTAKSFTDEQGKLKSQRTITVTGNITLSETHNGAVLNVTNTCNITIPTGLDANFQCVVFAKGSIIVTFVNVGVTVYAPSGLLLKTDKMASLISTSANNFNLTGELATS